MLLALNAWMATIRCDMCSQDCCKAFFPLHMAAISKDKEQPNLLSNGLLLVEQQTMEDLCLLRIGITMSSKLVRTKLL